MVIRFEDKSKRPQRNAAAKIKAGLEETIALAKGEVEPARIHRAGRPRIEDKHLTLAAQKPWEALGMSRRTWQRRQKEKRDA